jgi:hypothetical protein
MYNALVRKILLIMCYFIEAKGMEGLYYITIGGKSFEHKDEQM